MERKYWPLEMVARRLGLKPPTLRRWVDEGRIRAVRLGGTGGHRRIPYQEVARLAAERGEPQWPPLEAPDPAARYRVGEAAFYLGVSPRFLWNAGFLASQGGLLTGADILALESSLYDPGAQATPVGPEPWPAEDDTEGGEDIMHGHHGMHGGMRGGMGRGSMGGPMAASAWGGRGGPCWQDWDAEDSHSVLWLRSMKRHLEARKADIEDRLAWVEEALKKAEQAGPQE